MQQVRDAEQSDDDENPDQNLDGARAADQEQDVIDEDARRNDVDDVRYADVARTR